MMLVCSVAQLESCYCCVCDKLAEFLTEHFKSKSSKKSSKNSKKSSKNSKKSSKKSSKNSKKSLQHNRSSKSC